MSERDPVTTSSPLGARLKEVVVNIRNSAWSIWSRPSAIWVYARICVGDTCCGTNWGETRGGLLKFSKAFENIGRCSELTKRENEEVQLQVLTSESDTPLRVSDIVASFGENLYTANSHSGIIAWGDFSRTTESEAAEVPFSFPPAQCPGDENTVINTCPKEHVRVLKELAFAQKFCIYQR